MEQAGKRRSGDCSTFVIFAGCVVVFTGQSRVNKGLWTLRRLFHFLERFALSVRTAAPPMHVSFAPSSLISKEIFRCLLRTLSLLPP